MKTHWPKLITKLNAIFKTDMAYLLHGVGWLGGTKIVTSVFSFILAIAFANLLPAETYGTYGYVMATISIIALVSLPGIDSSLLRSVARGFDGSLFLAQKTRLKWSALGTVCLLIISGYYFTKGDMVLSSSFLVSGIIFPVFVSFSLVGYYLNGKQLLRELAIRNVVIKLLFAASLGTVLFFSDNVALLIAVNMGVIGIVSIIFTRQIVVKHKNQLNTPPEEGLISYGKHLTAMSILDTIAKSLDKILLWHFLGPIQVAMWTFAYTPVQIFQGLVRKTLGPLALPKFSQNDFGLTKQQLPAKVVKLFLILLPVALLYVFIAPFLFAYVFPQYTESVIYSQALVPLLLLIPFNFFSAFLLSQARKKDMYIIKISFGLSSIVLLLILIPLFGLWGAVLAHTGALSIRSIVSWILFARAR